MFQSLTGKNTRKELIKSKFTLEAGEEDRVEDFLSLHCFALGSSSEIPKKSIQNLLRLNHTRNEWRKWKLHSE
jgi:hypothetical protein